MARKLVFGVRLYEQGRRGALRPGRMVAAPSAAHAERLAMRMALRGAGAIALAREIDEEHDAVGEPVILATFGAVPDDFSLSG